MKTAIVLGASGLVGNSLTQKLLDDSYYETVTVLVRKSLKISHPKLIERIVDFNQLYKERIQADDVFCCLGTTIKKAKSKENFKLVDYTYSLNVAKIARKYDSNQFIIITSMGANKESMVFYSKIKGKLEEEIKALDFNSLLIIRPSLLIGNRTNDVRPIEMLSGIIMQVLSFLLPKKTRAIKINTVANAMISLSRKNYSGVNVFESNLLQAYK